MDIFLIVFFEHNTTCKHQNALWKIKETIFISSLYLVPIFGYFQNYTNDII